jgi:hypothetical protein
MPPTTRSKAAKGSQAADVIKLIKATPTRQLRSLFNVSQQPSNECLHMSLPRTVDASPDYGSFLGIGSHFEGDVSSLMRSSPQ